jgi:hypothetical protein
VSSGAESKGPAGAAGLGIGSLSQLGIGSVEYALGFGLGVALGAALDPIGTGLRQEAWKVDPLRAPDAGMLAGGVAQGQVDHARAVAWAKEHGYDGQAFAAMVATANVGPALGLAFQARRRGVLTPEQFTTALRRTGLEEEWYGAMRMLLAERLDPAAIATAVHRGIMLDASLIITPPPTGPGKVPHVPPSPLDPVDESAAHGIDHERLRVLVGNTGLPLALGEMLQLLNRGEVTADDVRRSVAQSNVRNEYMDVALGLRRRLLTPHEYADHHLRGWSGPDAMHAGAALSGMEHGDTDKLFELLGRPIPVHQVTTGEARGGHFDGAHGDIPRAYLKALQQSSMRPEWYSLAYANRYTYPSAFVLRSLVQSGDLSGDEGHSVLLKLGWEPALARKVVGRWAGGKVAKADPHVAKAEAQVWSTAHRSYLNHESTDAEAGSTLTLLGVAAEAKPRVLALWRHEREIVRRTLTPSQIKKAWKETKLTHDDALARLGRLGYSPADAELFLQE